MLCLGPTRPGRHSWPRHPCHIQQEAAEASAEEEDAWAPEEEAEEQAEDSAPQEELPVARPAPEAEEPANAKQDEQAEDIVPEEELPVAGPAAEVEGPAEGHTEGKRPATAEEVHIVASEDSEDD